MACRCQTPLAGRCKKGLQIPRGVTGIYVIVHWTRSTGRFVGEGVLHCMLHGPHAVPGHVG